MKLVRGKKKELNTALLPPSGMEERKERKKERNTDRTTSVLKVFNC